MDPFSCSRDLGGRSACLLVCLLACVRACLPSFVLSACAWSGPVPSRPVLSPVRSWCLLEGRLRPAWLLGPRLLPLSPASWGAQLCNTVSRKKKKKKKKVRPAAGPTGDGSITDVCLTAALSSCSLGTAPGRDGLPYEVYKVLWAELSEALVAN